MKIRRLLLTIAFVAFVSQLSGVAVIAQKTDAPSKPTIVIVHGAWGGAWAWRKVDALLRDKGDNVYRPQLTGLGERVHLSRPDIGLSTHIEDVVNTILFEDLHDIILVGHSYRGFGIPRVGCPLSLRNYRLSFPRHLSPQPQGKRNTACAGAHAPRKSM